MSLNNQPIGGPAFPVPGFEFLDDRNPAEPERVVNLPHPGMTLRDYFAAKAMQSLLMKDSNWREGWGRCTKTELSAEAYQFADAMIAARDEK